MTEITDLSPTDSSNTSISGFSTAGAIANMSTMDNVIQATLGMIGRWTASDTIASAGTTDIGAQAEAYLTVSGTTTITSFGTVRAGTIRFLRFSGILTLTHNATSLILPGAASITTAASDTAVFVSEGSGNWRCLEYQRASGAALVNSSSFTSSISVSATNASLTLNKGASGQVAALAGQTNGTIRWQVDLGDSTAESGSNNGSNFYLRSYSDAGSLLFNAIEVIRNSAQTTFAGNVVMSKTSPTLAMDKGASGQANSFVGRTGGVARWQIDMGDGTAESGSNNGSDWYLRRFSDAGSQLSLPITVIRSTGNVTFAHNVSITGSISKGSGTFLIDHPLDPENKKLAHGFIEGPRYDLIYRGTAKLKNGRAIIDIDAESQMTAGTFAALTINATVTSLQNQDGFTRLKPGAISGSSFEIICEDESSSDKVAWVVIAERNDRFVRELDDNCDENGRFIPERAKETA